MQTSTPTASASSPEPTPPRLINEPTTYCTSGGNRVGACSLIGWSEGLVSTDDWLRAGCPLDAPDRLPAGGCWAWRAESAVPTETHCLYGSTLREGVLA